MKKFQIVLAGRGGELDRTDVHECSDDLDGEADIQEALENAMSSWVLSIGDTISIIEVE